MPDEPVANDSPVEGGGPDVEEVPLTAVAAGREVRFVRARGGRGLRHRLVEIGLRPGSRFTVLTSGGPGPFIISFGGARLVVGHGMVHRIMVRPVRQQDVET